MRSHRWLDGYTVAQRYVLLAVYLCSRNSVQYDGIGSNPMKKQKRSGRPTAGSTPVQFGESVGEEDGVGDADGTEQQGQSQQLIQQKFVKSFTLERLFSYVSAECRERHLVWCSEEYRSMGVCLL